MSQRRQKKQLSIMDNVNSLTDYELRAALKTFNESPGPITDSTRNLYRKKLASLMEERYDNSILPQDSIFQQEETNKNNNLKSHQSGNALEEEDEDEDTSDEDYEVREDELNEEDEEFEDEDEEEEDLLGELQDDDMTSSRNNNIGIADISSKTLNESYASANGISRGIQLSLVSFFVIIFSYYLLSNNNFKLLEPLKPFKYMTKRLLILLALSPIGYIIYRTFRFYRVRSHEENERVCKLVEEALELLQSPDNPKGLMPILHIRDTLLTPAERKAKKMNILWQKAVKFIEENESRVKVELVNIDGEDFRAWKWIGARKL